MANKRHKPEEIVTKLRQVKVLVGLHGRTELPGDDVAGIIVEDGRRHCHVVCRLAVCPTVC